MSTVRLISEFTVDKRLKNVEITLDVCWNGMCVHTVLSAGNMNDEIHLSAGNSTGNIGLQIACFRISVSCGFNVIG